MKPVVRGTTHGQAGGFPLAGQRAGQPANLQGPLPPGQAAHHAGTFVGIRLSQLLHSKYNNYTNQLLLL